MGKKKFEISPEEMEISRIRTPRQGEVLGVIEMMLGADKVRARCDDGNTRICRIPGRLRKRVWVKPGDLILIEPWKVQANERGDIIFRYTSTQANWLKRRGFIKSISAEW
ncbi:MAG TPA: translation initiation factor eIF-1A [archaeon]|nr:translation initiation factor eIF-1A [archaeon]